jgi:vancomycin resistance protein YoaR
MSQETKLRLDKEKFLSNLKKISIITFSAILVLLIFLLLTYVFFEKKFDNRIYPNVFLANIDLSGLSRDEAQILIDKKINDFESQGIKIKLNNKEMIWYNLSSAFDPDLAVLPLVYNTADISSQAYLVARDGSYLEIFNKIKAFFFKTELPLEFDLDREELKKIIKENFSDQESPVKETSLVFEKKFVDSKEQIVFSVQAGQSGYEIDYDLFFSELQSRLASLDGSDINLKIINKKPQINLSDVSLAPQKAQEIIDLAPLKLISAEKKKTFTIEALDLANWLKIKEDLRVGLDEEKIELYFTEKIAPQINQEALQPKIELKGERVSIFEPGRDGLIVDYEASILAIEEAIANKDLSQVALVTQVEKIEKISGSNELGIFELIGSGHSNFAGSSANRRHNIKTGASKLHGLIIKPGEEFSLVNSLGKVDGSTGYLEELVIKGNKTIPEYGGGLCQIATTIFRAALGSGLPITERRNHSYRVSYYEPAGTDATIYTPRPDLKFKNDTGNNILIQARFEGANDIYFDFWGKSDGRTATTTYPVIYNIVKPGPTQIIETTDLKPGEKKCTEKAHSGADAYFDYTVIYNQGKENENKVETRFSSKYVPWREVCLVGVEPKTETASSTATSTESISSSTGQLN